MPFFKWLNWIILWGLICSSAQTVKAFLSWVCCVSAHFDLLQHNKVRWLSSGPTIEHFCKIRCCLLPRQLEYKRSKEWFGLPRERRQYASCGFNERFSETLKWPQYRATRNWIIILWSDSKYVSFLSQYRTGIYLLSNNFQI